MQERKSERGVDPSLTQNFMNDLVQRAVQLAILQVEIKRGFGEWQTGGCSITGPVSVEGAESTP